MKFIFVLILTSSSAYAFGESTSNLGEFQKCQGNPISKNEIVKLLEPGSTSKLLTVANLHMFKRFCTVTGCGAWGKSQDVHELHQCHSNWASQSYNELHQFVPRQIKVVGEIKNSAVGINLMWENSEPYASWQEIGPILHFKSQTNYYSPATNLSCLSYVVVTDGLPLRAEGVVQNYNALNFYGKLDMSGCLYMESSGRLVNDVGYTEYRGILTNSDTIK